VPREHRQPPGRRPGITIVVVGRPACGVVLAGRAAAQIVVAGAAEFVQEPGQRGVVGAGQRLAVLQPAQRRLGGPLGGRQRRLAAGLAGGVARVAALAVRAGRLGNAAAGDGGPPLRLIR
jgi:hypothetical protein